MVDCNVFLDTIRTLKTSKMEVLTFLTWAAVASHAKTDILGSNPFLCLGICDEHFLCSFFPEHFVGGKILWLKILFAEHTLWTNRLQRWHSRVRHWLGLGLFRAWYDWKSCKISFSISLNKQKEAFFSQMKEKLTFSLVFASSSSALWRLFPFSLLDSIFPHFQWPACVMQLLIQSTGIADWWASGISCSTPQWGLVSSAV